MYSKELSPEAMSFINGFLKVAALTGALGVAQPARAMLPVPPKVLGAERMQETSNSPNWGITGDHKRALGPLQVHRPAYLDAVHENPALSQHPYSYVTNLPYANQVYTAYQNRYNAPALKALQVNPANQQAIGQLGAAWNGGPAKLATPGTGNYVHQLMQKYLNLK